MDGWGLWMASKAAAGVDIGKIVDGAEFKGMFVGLLEHVAETLGVSSAAVTRAKFVMRMGGYVSAAMTILNLVEEKAGLSAHVTMDGGEPLERHKKRSDGDGRRKRLTIKIEHRPPLSDDAKTALNCLATLMTAIGNNTTFSTSGPVEGVEVQIRGLQGFTRNLDTRGTLVLFGPEEVKLRQSTDSAGTVSLGVQGRQRERDVPDNARARMKQFSILVEAQPKPVDLSKISKTLADSLLCMAAPGLGCVDSAGDIAETYHVNLGEFSFALRDWESPGFKYSLKPADVEYSGMICDLEKPFDWHAKHPIATMTIHFMPAEAHSGSLVIDGSYPPKITFDGSGTYELLDMDSKSPRMKIHSHGCTFYEGKKVACKDEEQTAELEAVDDCR